MGGFVRRRGFFFNELKQEVDADNAFGCTILMVKRCGRLRYAFVFLLLVTFNPTTAVAQGEPPLSCWRTFSHRFPPRHFPSRDGVRAALLRLISSRVSHRRVY